MIVTLRVRSLVWLATGAVLALLATLLVTQAWRVDAAPGDEDATFVAIAPCRLFDMRDGALPAGGKKSPMGPGEVHTQQVTGAVGNCIGIPSDAVAVALNVTIVGPTAASNLTVFPADVATPLVSNLNWVAGQSPTPNKVDVKLSADGKIKFFNQFGAVSVLTDVVGYYSGSSLKELSNGLDMKVGGELFASSSVKVIATEAASVGDARTAAPETLLFTRGSIEIYAKCMYDTAAGDVAGEIYVRTSVDGALLEGEDDLPGTSTVGGTEMLDIATLETDRQLDIHVVTVANAASFDEAEGVVMDNDGSVFGVLTNIGLKQGSPSGGNGPFGDGNVCMFGGTVLGE